MTSENTSSNTWRTRSVRKRFMVMWSSGLMPQIQRNPTFSLVARAMARLEWTPDA